MEKYFYRLISVLHRSGASWLLEFMVGFVTAGFFIFFPTRVRLSTRFYRTLFPHRGRFFPLWYAWRQYHHFSQGYLERLRLLNSTAISYTSEGWGALRAAHDTGKGGIIVMSHMGNWEVAAHLLKKRGPQMKLMLYMGVKQKKQIEALQKIELARGGIQVLGVGQEEDPTFTLIPAIDLLQKGGFVSMTGDMLWSRGQRSVTVRFLDHPVRLPVTPHMLALISGAPVFILFAFRVCRKTYHFRIIGPRFVRASSRKQRAEAILNAVQAYANLLEEAVYEHPLQWYHFEPFLDTALAHRAILSPYGMHHPK